MTGAGGQECKSVSISSEITLEKAPGRNGTKLRRLTAFSNGEIDTSPGKRHRLHPGVNGQETHVG